jgi:hypothetical protein
LGYLQVLDRGCASQVIEVLSGSQVSGAIALPLADVSEPMLYWYALTKTFAAGTRPHHTAEFLLAWLIVGNQNAPPST